MITIRQANEAKALTESNPDAAELMLKAWDGTQGKLTEHSMQCKFRDIVMYLSHFMLSTNPRVRAASQDLLFSCGFDSSGQLVADVWLPGGTLAPVIHYVKSDKPYRFTVVFNGTTVVDGATHRGTAPFFSSDKFATELENLVSKEGCPVALPMDEQPPSALHALQDESPASAATTAYMESPKPQGQPQTQPKDDGPAKVVGIVAKAESQTKQAWVPKDTLTEAEINSAIEDLRKLVECGE